MKQVTGVVATRFYQTISLEVKDDATEDDIKGAILNASNLHGPTTEFEFEILDFDVGAGGEGGISMIRDEIVNICQDALKSNGWILDNGGAIAYKDFRTAVGIKRAFAYVSESDSFNFLLSGDYQSQGRNILSTSGELIRIFTTRDGVKQQSEQFSENVDAEIAVSYAARLL